MSKAGCPYDNAPMERFYNTLKQELIYRTSFVSEDALKEAINHYVFVWYNHIRLLWSSFFVTFLTHKTIFFYTFISNSYSFHFLYFTMLYLF